MPTFSFYIYLNGKEYLLLKKEREETFFLLSHVYIIHTHYFTHEHKHHSFFISYIHLYNAYSIRHKCVGCQRHRANIFESRKDNDFQEFNESFSVDIYSVHLRISVYEYAHNIYTVLPQWIAS